MKRQWKRMGEKRYYFSHKEKVLARQKRRLEALKNGTYKPASPFTKEDVAKHTIYIE